jgi:hypothetical protein
LRLPSQQFKHQFEILNLGNQPYQFILGADLIEFFFPYPNSPPWEFVPPPLAYKSGGEHPVLVCTFNVSAASTAVVDSNELRIGELSGTGSIPEIELPIRARLSTTPDVDDSFREQAARLRQCNRYRISLVC